MKKILLIIVIFIPLVSYSIETFDQMGNMRPEARKAFKDGCAMGRKEDCKIINLLKIEKHLNVVNTRWLFERAKQCKTGEYASSCNQIGDAFWKINEKQNAKKYYKKSCELGNDYGCNVIKNREKGKQRFSSFKEVEKRLCGSSSKIGSIALQNPYDTVGNCYGGKVKIHTILSSNQATGYVYLGGRNDIPLIVSYNNADRKKIIKGHTVIGLFRSTGIRNNNESTIVEIEILHLMD